MTHTDEEFRKDHFDKVMYLCGLIEQLATITDVLYKEKENIEKQKENSKPTIEHPNNHSVRVLIPFINTTLETALKSSILFFQFSVLEAIINVLSDLTIQINASKYFFPKTPLSQAEIDFILECSTYFDPQNEKVTKRTSFKRLEDKICQVPALFAKMMNTEFKLSKIDGHWEMFKELKNIRDSLTHPKLQRLQVGDKQIYNGSLVIYWLSEHYFSLIRNTLYDNDFGPYRYIENSSLKVILISYHATLKQYDMSAYLEKHKLLLKK